MADSIAAFITEPLKHEIKGRGRITIPAGPCAIKQTLEKATLYCEKDGQQQAISLPIDDFHRLLAEEKVKRQDPA